MILEAIKFSNSFFTRNFIRIVFICAIPILFISIFQLTIDPLPWDNLTELSFTTLVFQSFNILFQIAFLWHGNVPFTKLQDAYKNKLRL